MELSLVMPAYREEENLRLLLPRIKKTLDAQNIEYEVLVVDTPRPLDHTELLCSEFKGVRHLRRQGGEAFGDAVRTGIAESKGRFVLFMDSDGSHGPEFIPELLAYRGSSDVVIASRYVDGGSTENPVSLIWMSRILNWTYSLVLGLRCKDVSNSFKLYRGDALRALDLYCDNFDVIEEILFKLGRANRDLRIREVPFAFKARMFGETKRNLLAFIATYVLTMVRLRLSVYSTLLRKLVPRRGQRPVSNEAATPVVKTLK